MGGSRASPLLAFSKRNCYLDRPRRVFPHLTKDELVGSRDFFDLPSLLPPVDFSTKGFGGCGKFLYRRFQIPGDRDKRFPGPGPPPGTGGDDAWFWWATIPAVGRLLHFLNFVKSLLSTCPFYRPRENRAYEIPVGVGAQPPAETDYLKPAPLCPVRTFVGGIPNLATRAIVAIHLITVSSPLWRTRLSTPSRAWVWSYSYARVSSGSAAKVNGRRHTKPSDQEQIESIQGWRAQGRRRKRAPEGCHGGFPTRRRTRPG